MNNVKDLSTNRPKAPRRKGGRGMMGIHGMAVEAPKVNTEEKEETPQTSSVEKIEIPILPEDPTISCLKENCQDSNPDTCKMNKKCRICSWKSCRKRLWMGKSYTSQSGRLLKAPSPIHSAIKTINKSKIATLSSDAIHSIVANLVDRPMANSNVNGGLSRIPGIRPGPPGMGNPMGMFSQRSGRGMVSAITGQVSKNLGISTTAQELAKNNINQYVTEALKRINQNQKFRNENDRRTAIRRVTRKQFKANCFLDVTNACNNIGMVGSINNEVCAPIDHLMMPDSILFTSAKFRQVQKDHDECWRCLSREGGSVPSCAVMGF